MTTRLDRRKASFKSRSSGKTMSTNTRGRARLNAMRGRIARNPASLRGIAPRGDNEVYSVDLPAAPVTHQISTTGRFTLLNGVQTGNGFFNRRGRKMTMKSLHLTGQFHYSGQDGVGTNEYLRVMVVYDREANGAFPTSAQILANTDNTGTNVTNSLSNRNMTEAERFLVLRDIRVAIPQDANVATTSLFANVIDYNNQRINIDEFIDLKGLETVFSASTNPAAIGDITAGSLFLFTLGNTPDADAPYSVSFNARLRFFP